MRQKTSGGNSPVITSALKYVSIIPRNSYKSIERLATGIHISLIKDHFHISKNT